MFQADSALVSRRQVGRDLTVLAFAAPEVAEAALPGQFVNLLLRPGPLLRRPFSIHRAKDGCVEVLLRSVGVGTAQLLGLSEGDRVSLLGPLGTGFRFDPGWRSVALVSGGLGVAPFPMAALAARAAGLEVTWVHGARSAADLCSEWEGEHAVWATDDGSRGHHGSVVDAVPEVGAVLACGPNPMLAAVARRWPEAQVAVETYMGCGTGVCLGCAVPKVPGGGLAQASPSTTEPGGVPPPSEGFDRACKEGPVYRAGDVAWQALPGHLHYALGA